MPIGAISVLVLSPWSPLFVYFPWDFLKPVFVFSSNNASSHSEESPASCAPVLMCDVLLLFNVNWPFFSSLLVAMDSEVDNFANADLTMSAERNPI